MNNINKLLCLKVMILLFLIGILTGCSNPILEIREIENKESMTDETQKETHEEEKEKKEEDISRTKKVRRKDFKINDNVLIADVLLAQNNYRDVAIFITYEDDRIDELFPDGLKIQVDNFEFLTITKYDSDFIIHTYLEEGIHEICIYNEGELLCSEEITVKKAGNDSMEQEIALLIELYGKNLELEVLDDNYINSINHVYIGNYMDGSLNIPTYKYSEDKDHIEGIRYYIPLVENAIDKLGKNDLLYDLDSYGMGAFISIQAVQIDYSDGVSEELLRQCILEKGINLDEAYDVKSFYSLSSPGIRCLFDVSDDINESVNDVLDQAEKEITDDLKDEIELYIELGLITREDISEFEKGMTDSQIRSSIENELRRQGMNLEDGRTEAIFLMKDDFIYSIMVRIPSLSDEMQDAVCNEIIQSFEEYTMGERELFESLINTYYCQNDMGKKMDIKIMPDAVNIGCLFDNGHMEWVYFHLLKETEENYIIGADITLEGITQLAVNKNDFSELKTIGSNVINSDEDISIIDVYSSFINEMEKTIEYEDNMLGEWIFEDSDKRFIM